MDQMEQSICQIRNGRVQHIEENKEERNNVGVYTVWGIVVQAWSIHGHCRLNLAIAGWTNSELGVS